MLGKTRFVIAGLLIVTAVAYLIVSNTGTTAHFFLTIEELQAAGPEAMGLDVTISGAVLGHTIVYDPSAPRVTFTVAQVPADPDDIEEAGGLAKVLRAAVNDPDAPRLDIVYDDVKPDLLRHEAQAIVRGRQAEDGRFHADDVLLKCPTRYEEEVPAQAGNP